MSILFRGTCIHDFVKTSGAWTRETTAARLAPYVSEGLGLTINTGGRTAAKADFDPKNELWISFYWYAGSFTSGTYWFSACLADGTPVVRLGSGTVNLWDGITHTNLGAFDSNSGFLQRFDVYIKLHATQGVVRIYRDKDLAFQFVGNTLRNVAYNLIGSIIFNEGYTNGGAWVPSAIMVADEDTRPLEFVQLSTTANGANTGFTGGNAEIQTSTSDLTFISAATAGLKSSFAMADIPAALSALNPVEFTISGRGRVGKTGPQNIKGLVRTGGSDQVSANIAMQKGWAPFQAQFTINPATGLPWTIAEINALEPGVQSAT